jgi:hypothetical protein
MRLSAPAPFARTAALRKALAASVALLCVAIQGASITHLLLTRHAVCLEHGELVHADDATLAGGHDLTATAPTGVAIGSARGSAVTEHADEHCAVLATRREYAILSAPAQVLADRVAGSDGALSPPAAPLAEGRARYDVAPKQSPPA